LDSALAQDVPLRVIVVDDGSTDNSADIARSYGPRVHVIVQQNQGVSGARNTALAAATAPYVAFLDQDDVWKPGKLRRQVELIERHPEVGMVFTDMTLLESDGAIVEDGFLANTPPYARLVRAPLGGDAFLLPQALDSAIVRENFISPSTALVRTRALKEIGGFDTQFRLADDVECWMRLLHRWRGIAIEDRLVLSYFWGGNASVVKWRNLAQERVRIGEKVRINPALFAADAPDYFRREFPVVHYKLGLSALRSGETGLARRHLLISLQRGGSPAAIVALFATFLPAFVRQPLLKLKRSAGIRWTMRAD